MISQYKYYTRALSPIHVRVIYDLGPPEAFDAKERWMLKLLSSIKLLTDSEYLSPSDMQIQNLANVLMSIMMFDSEKLSSGAVVILLKLLATPGVVSDLTLIPLAPLVGNRSDSGRVDDGNGDSINNGSKVTGGGLKAPTSGAIASSNPSLPSSQASIMSCSFLDPFTLP